MLLRTPDQYSANAMWIPIAGELESLRASLDSEVAARKAAEEESDRVHVERQRLQKARDDLATTLLVGLSVELSPRCMLHTKVWRRGSE